MRTGGRAEPGKELRLRRALIMRMEPDQRVRIEVVSSECPLMKEGATVYLNGPLIDYERSAPVCVSALVGIYPWVMTARFGIESEKLGHTPAGYRLCCPDKLVEFSITACTESGAHP
ncbi:TIGR04076 family protein [Geobacter argillaceus]|uniref:Putative repeat protein (TIGR04076 family) n=1 Tax=Geobacter argillaceus TaxID=345631 RepID=A0A562WR58_9BACT|nr:TIGR04076 family protein [Geobacter argillaceus]TWJ32636.1 putative repeat protein (TIGR04076 family) [Geobacter argillaceus]